MQPLRGHCPNGRTRRHHQAGFTLFETILVIGVLALVSAGIASMQPSVFKTQTTGRDEFAHSLVPQHAGSEHHQRLSAGGLLGREIVGVNPGSGHHHRALFAHQPGFDEHLTVVGDSAQLLADAVAHMTFVSSVSVYADHSVPGIDETAPVGMLEDGAVEEITGETYGPLKALCERAVEEAFPGRSLIIRPGLIVGPHDPTGRFTYWPHRIARGGEVLAPGPPERSAQFVDVRDLAAWILRASEDRLSGPFNVTSEPLPFAALLESCRRVAGADPQVSWVDEDFLLEHEVGQWLELPLWVAAKPGSEHVHEVDTTKAHGAGLRERPLDETVRGALEQAAPVDGVGLASDREAELLREWHDR